MTATNNNTNRLQRSTTNNGMGSGRRAEENEKLERSGKTSQVNIETLKAGDETIAQQLAKLYTKCITERASLKHGRKQIW